MRRRGCDSSASGRPASGRPEHDALASTAERAADLAAEGERKHELSFDRRYRVLVVDDDHEVRGFFEDALQLEGFETIGVASAAEAFDALQLGEPDVIVSDISMPGLSGVGLLRRLREQSMEVPVILVTGDPSLQSALDAIKLDVYGYLCKPVSPDELLGTVVGALAQSKGAALRQVAASLASREGSSGESRLLMGEIFSKLLSKVRVVYQPIFDVLSSKIYGHEVLMRTDVHELSGPADAFTVAEMLGGLHQLGRAVRAATAKGIEKAPDEAVFFVNLHPADIEDPRLFSRDDALAPHAERIVLEITERSRLDHLPDLRKRVAALRSMGYRIAIDDLGAGYSGLTSVAILEPDVVKLDLELIREVHLNSIRRRLIRSLVELFAEMGVLVIAEGVECMEELEALTELGCGYVQGYLLAMPAPELSLSLAGVPRFRRVNGRPATCI